MFYLPRWVSQYHVSYLSVWLSSSAYIMRNTGCWGRIETHIRFPSPFFFFSLQQDFIKLIKGLLLILVDSVSLWLRYKPW